MAHSLSAKKRVRQNEKRRMLNRARRSTLKGRVRKCLETLTAGQAEATTTALRSAEQALDRAADRGTLHRNAAARRKSRLARRLNALKQKAAG